MVFKTKLILSDRPLNINIKSDDIKFINLSSLKIANCIGCYGCWTKTPGKCVIRDDAVKIYPDIAKSDKLLVFKLQLGDEVRQVVSGIAQHYAPQDLVGKTVVIVANLKPAKIRGVESNGMILCAADGTDVVFVTPQKEIGSGVEVR